MGIARGDVLIDCLVLPVGAEPESAGVTLAAIRGVKETLGVGLALGVSNTSFGLPNRPLLNHSLAVAAIAAGVNALIAVPGDLCATIRAADLLLGHDEFAERYIAHHRSAQARIVTPSG